MKNQHRRIESRDNTTYRTIAAIRRPRRSQKTGLIFLEGFRLCQDALESGVAAVYFLLSDSAADLPVAEPLQQLAGESVQTLILPDHLFKTLCDTQNPQGVALVCQAPAIDQPPDPPSDNGLYLIAENIQDPGNLGTMIRTADAFAFDAVLLTESTVYPFNDKVVRAAMGSCFHLPLVCFPDIKAVSAWFRTSDRPGTLLAADPSAAGYLPADIRLPAALIVGNEARGLSPEAREICRKRVAVAMPGRAESLNVAAAAAVLCHDLMRYRIGRNNKSGAGS
ncbi:MAG: RNA methyltransferase [Clostridiaceae bacterium]|nr:RNA methyltransferase [Clostridiaceae bacterium]